MLRSLDSRDGINESRLQSSAANENYNCQLVATAGQASNFPCCIPSSDLPLLASLLALLHSWVHHAFWYELKRRRSTGRERGRRWTTTTTADEAADMFCPQARIPLAAARRGGLPRSATLTAWQLSQRHAQRLPALLRPLPPLPSPPLLLSICNCLVVSCCCCRQVSLPVSLICATNIPSHWGPTGMGISSHAASSPSTFHVPLAVPKLSSLPRTNAYFVACTTFGY